MFARIVATGVRKALERLGNDIAVVARQSLGQAASYAAELARATDKFKDGPNARLRGSIRRDVRSAYSIFVKAGARHGLFVEDGTKAHEIRPKMGAGVSGPVRPGQGRRSSGSERSVLRFVIGGRTFFRPSVRHPGTKATHFMRDARDGAERELTRFVEVGIRHAVSG